MEVRGVMLFKHLGALLGYGNTLVTLVVSTANRQVGSQDFRGLFTGCFSKDAQEGPEQ